MTSLYTAKRLLRIPLGGPRVGLYKVAAAFALRHTCSVNFARVRRMPRQASEPAPSILRRSFDSQSLTFQHYNQPDNEV